MTRHEELKSMNKNMSSADNKFMCLAIEKAKESLAQGGFPAGALVVRDGEIIGTGISVGDKISDATAHGEMVAIRDACKTLESSNLTGATLYASLQPCMMCFGASMWSKISKIIYACSKEKVSDEYYGGNYHINIINRELINPVDLVHYTELESESLATVHQWERVVLKGL